MNAGTNDNPAESTVTFIGPDGRIAGLGVLVGPGQVITNPEVVIAQLGMLPGATPPIGRHVTVIFPHSSAPDATRTVRVTQWKPEHDIAALTLVADGPPTPPGTAPARLQADLPAQGTPVHFRGFTESSPTLVTATIRGQVAPDQLQLNPLPDDTPPVDTGSPVYDDRTGAVVGLLLPRQREMAGVSTQASPAARKLTTAAKIRSFRLEAFTAPPNVGGVDLLHLSDLRVGDPGRNADWLARLLVDIVGQSADGGIRPDLVIVTGDLTAVGEKPQLNRAFEWLAALAKALDVPRSSVVVVPGERDVNARLRVLERERAALLGRPYDQPYPAKWNLFASASAQFYDESGVAPFDPERPWSLRTVPDKRVVVAALNSTMSLDGHESEDTGEVTATQVADIRARLQPYRERGWLRLGAVHHNPAAFETAEQLQNPDDVTGLLSHDEVISLLLHGHALGDHSGTAAGIVGAGGAECRYHLIRIDPDRYLVHSRDFGPDRPSRTGRPTTTTRDFGLRPEPNDAAERAATDEFRQRVRRAIEVRLPGVALSETGRTDGSIYRVGGHTVRALHGPVTRQEIEDVAADARAPIPGQVTIVHSGPPPGTELNALARKGAVQLCTLVAYQQVVNLTAAFKRQREVLAGDRQHVAEHYVPQGFHLADSAEAPSQTDDLAAEIGAWFTDDTTPLIMLTGAAGSGKSALLRRLARELAAPLLIDLRRFDSTTATSVDALLVRSLLDLGVTDLRLERLRYLLAEGLIAVLLDGLDDLAERSGSDAARELVVELVRASTPHSKIVLATSDPSHSPAATWHRTAVLDPFTTERAEQYLTRRLGTGSGPRTGLKVESLSRHPRSLVLLAGLGPDRLRAAKEGRIELATLYPDLVAAWAQDEITRWPNPDDRPSFEQWKRKHTQQALAMTQRRSSVNGSDLAADPLADWLVAEAVAEELRTRGDTLLRTLKLTPLTGDQLVTIAEALVRAWADGDHPAESIAEHNAMSIQERLDEARAGADTEGSGGAESPEAALREAVLAGDIAGEIHAVVGGAVQCLAYGDGGRLIAVGRGDVVEIVDRVGAQVIRRLVRHSSTVRGVTFYAGDRYVMSASEDGTVYKWEAESGSFVQEFTGHQKPVTAITVSKPANLLVTASADGTVRTWNPDTGEPAGKGVFRRQSGTEPANELSAIAADPTRPVVVAGAQDAKAVAWDIGTGELLFELDHDDSVTAVAFAPDGSFVTATNRGRATRWNSAGEELELLLGTGSAITCVAFSPGGDLIAVGRRTGELQLRRLPDGKDWQSWVAHAEPVTAVTFPAGGQVTTTGQDGMVKTRSVKGNRLLLELESHTYWATGLAFHDRGEGRVRLAAATWDGAVNVWNLPGGETETVLGKPSGALNGVAFAPDGDRIVAGQLLDPPVAHLWRLSTGHRQDLSGHYDGLTGVGFTPDGRFIATVAEDHSFIVWDSGGNLLHRRPIRQDGERSEAVTCLAFRTDDELTPLAEKHGPMLATGHGNILRLWQPETGVELSGLRLEHRRTLNAVAFVPASDKIVTATRDNLAWIWDLADPQRHFAPLEGHKGSVNCVAVSPDGKLAATGSSDNTAGIYWTGNGERLHTLTGHAGGLTAVAFSPNSKMLATAARDNTIRLWKVDSEQVIATYYLLRDGASVGIRSDGAYRTHGDTGTGLWWASGLCRVRLDELRGDGAGPRPLADGEELVPADLVGR